jgi:hypothetical protein
MARWLPPLVLLLLAALWWLAHVNSAPLAATGTGATDACRVLVPAGALVDVVQTSQSAPAFRAGDARITPLAGLSVVARVLGREDYSLDRESAYSPTDLALGWGPMAAPGMAERLSVSQAGRAYRYRWGNEGPPMSPDDIATHSANMHLVPADATVAAALARVRAGEQIHLEGWLVRIDADDGWHWASSMSRADVGDGSCELVLVCTIAPR